MTTVPHTYIPDTACVRFGDRYLHGKSRSHHPERRIAIHNRPSRAFRRHTRLALRPQPTGFNPSQITTDAFRSVSKCAPSVSESKDIRCCPGVGFGQTGALEYLLCKAMQRFI
jgi:hypothetical protein